VAEKPIKNGFFQEYKKIYVGICQASLHDVNYDVIIRKTSTSPTSLQHHVVSMIRLKF